MLVNKTEYKKEMGNKLKSLKARNNTLEALVREGKNSAEQTHKLLMEKSQNDDKYITALKKEINKLRKENEKFRLVDIRENNFRDNKKRLDLAKKVKEVGL